MFTKQVLAAIQAVSIEVWNEAVHNRVPLVYGRDGYVYEVCPIREVKDV